MPSMIHVTKARTGKIFGLQSEVLHTPSKDNLTRLVLVVHMQLQAATLNNPSFQRSTFL